MTYDLRFRLLTLFKYDSSLGTPFQRRLVTSYFMHINESTIRTWLDLRDQGNLLPRRKRNRVKPPVIANEHRDFLIAYLRDVNCQLYIDEMVAFITARYPNIVYSNHQVRDLLRENKYTNKVIEDHAREQNDGLRAIYRNMMIHRTRGGAFSTDMLLWADETHQTRKDARRKYGWALRGRPAFRRLHNLNGTNDGITAVCMMGIEGVKSVAIVHGGNDANQFMRICRESFIPIMEDFPGKNSVLIVDNASIHNHATLTALFRSKNKRVMFLPPYSYDFNPIELVFGLAKQKLKREYPQMNPAMPLPDIFEHCLLNCCTADQACNLVEHCHHLVTPAERDWAIL